MRLRVDEFEGEFLLGPKSHLLHRVLAFGAYEPELAQLFVSHIDPDRDVIDVGANVGFFTNLAARKLETGRVLAIESEKTIVLGRDEKDFKKKWTTAQRTIGGVFDLEKTAFRGTPDQVVEQLRARVAEGVTFFTFLLSDFHVPESLRLFAEKVWPAFGDR